MEYDKLSEVNNLKVFHVVRKDKRQYEIGEKVFVPFDKRDFSHWPKYKQEAERILEEERLDKYPDYPSRDNCLFAALDMDSALNWARDKFRQGGEFYLYELEITEGVIINLDTDYFEEIAAFLSNGEIPLSRKYTLEECIQNYWAGKSFRTDDCSMREVLVNGEIRVISKTLYHYERLKNKMTIIGSQSFNENK